MQEKQQSTQEIISTQLGSLQRMLQPPEISLAQLLAPLTRPITAVKKSFDLDSKQVKPLQISAEKAKVSVLEALAIPDYYQCSITHQIMREPVMASDGFTYEEEAITQVINTTGKSPKTREALTDTKIPNRGLISAISELLTRHPHLVVEDDVYLPESYQRDMLAALRHDEATVRRLIEKDHRLLTQPLRVPIIHHQ
ncbi:MAG: U-box domain-containing protein [Gammaproteobacteria bacterium]